MAELPNHDRRREARSAAVDPAASDRRAGGGRRPGRRTWRLGIDGRDLRRADRAGLDRRRIQREESAASDRRRGRRSAARATAIWSRPATSWCGSTTPSPRRALRSSPRTSTACWRAAARLRGRAAGPRQDRLSADAARSRRRSRRQERDGQRDQIVRGSHHRADRTEGAIARADHAVERGNRRPDGAGKGQGPGNRAGGKGTGRRRARSTTSIWCRCRA